MSSRLRKKKLTLVMEAIQEISNENSPESAPLALALFDSQARALKDHFFSEEFQAGSY